MLKSHACHFCSSPQLELKDSQISYIERFVASWLKSVLMNLDFTSLVLRQAATKTSRMHSRRLHRISLIGIVSDSDSHRSIPNIASNFHHRSAVPVDNVSIYSLSLISDFNSMSLAILHVQFR